MRGYRPRRVSTAHLTAQTEFLASAHGQRPTRVDANHAELVAHAEAIGGYFVRVGPLDGWLWNPRTLSWRPVEIKTPAVEGHAHEYTPQQKRFMRWCSERNAVWWTWRDKTDVEVSLGARRTA